MKQIDVFIDVEGVGMPQRPARCVHKIKLIAEELRPALLREGFNISTVTAFACYCRPRKALPIRIQEGLSEIFASYGWKMVWSRSIADLALIDAALRRLQEATLSDAVMIITNDHDFIDLVRRLKNAGLFVLVSGPSMNKRLEKAASKAMSLREFLTDPVEEARRRAAKLERDAIVFNPIPLP